MVSPRRLRYLSIRREEIMQTFARFIVASFVLGTLGVSNCASYFGGYHKAIPAGSPPTQQNIELPGDPQLVGWQQTACGGPPAELLEKTININQRP